MTSSLEVKNLHLIPGVSGSGKTTLAKYMELHLPNTSVSVSYTTRKIREGEHEGQDYYFRSKEHLDEMLSRDNEVWRYSKVGDHYYYARDDDTIPNDAHPTKILPVSFTTLREVIDDYSPHLSSGVITVIPLIISSDIQDKWLRHVKPIRSARNLTDELRHQEQFLLSSQFDGIYVPTWELEKDCSGYINLYKAILESKIGK